MYKKTRACFLCILLSVSLYACSGSGAQNLSKANPDTQGTAENGKNESDTEDGTEPLLGPDATDQDLIEALGDEVNIVTDDNYIEMVTAFKEHTEEHSGKIYQIEGAYHMEGGVPYVTRTIVKGDDKSVSGIPLKYLTTEPQEGDWIQVVGVINEGEIEGKATAMLEVVILQPLEKQGKEELIG